MSEPKLISPLLDGFVMGDPISYPRANTPGDYSWAVEAVSFDG